MEIKGTGTIFLCASMKARQQPWGIVLCTVVRPDFSSEKLITTIYSDGMYFLNTTWILCSGIIPLKYLIVVVYTWTSLFSFPWTHSTEIIWRPYHLIFIWVFQCQWKHSTMCCKVLGSEDGYGANESHREGDVLIFSAYSVIFLPFFPPSQQSLVIIPAPAGQWETMNLYPKCCHSFLSSTQIPVFPSLLSVASPLAVGKWTKALLNRLMHSVKARGLDLSWCGANAIHIGPRPAAR